MEFCCLFRTGLWFVTMSSVTTNAFAPPALLLLLSLLSSATAYIVSETFLCRFSEQPLHANCTLNNEPIPDVCSVIEGCLPEPTTISCPRCSQNQQHYVCDMYGCNATATAVNNNVQCQLYHFASDDDFCAPCHPTIRHRPPSAVVFRCPLLGRFKPLLIA